MTPLIRETPTTTERDLKNLIKRRALAGALALSPLLAVLNAQAQSSASIGLAAPDFSALDTQGKTHKLGDYKGKLVVLEWTNPGCPFVKKHYNGDKTGNMQSLQKEFTAKGVVWLSVNSTEAQSIDYLAPEKLASWQLEKGATPSATLMDESGKIGHLYGAKTTPHMYIISPKGVLLYAGGVDNIASTRVDDIKTASNYVRQALTEVLAGQPVSVAISKAYGCSIKYKT